MSFDISRLTSAVNKYLNSISDVSAAASKASQEIADKTRFSTDLAEAIKENIASKTRDIDEIPDIAAIVQDEVKSATGIVDSTFEQVNGAFLEISEAGKSAQTKDSAQAVAGVSEAASAKTSGNADAYSGQLSADALKELSGSGYFSANLITSSLFNEDDGSSDNSSSSSNNALNSLSSALTSSLGQNMTTANAFDTKSLEDLNTNSLLANALGTSTATAETVSSSNDLAKALIKAYTSNKDVAATTSIFGDFSL